MANKISNEEYIEKKKDVLAKVKAKLANIDAQILLWQGYKKDSEEDVAKHEDVIERMEKRIEESQTARVRADLLREQVFIDQENYTIDEETGKRIYPEGYEQRLQEVIELDEFYNNTDKAVTKIYYNR